MVAFFLVALSTITIIFVNSQSSCTTSGGITCTSTNGTSGNTSVSCPSSQILVSCGIFIDPNTNYISNGIEITDNQCNIIYNSSANNNESPKPIAIARCCEMSSCYAAQFECQLSVTRSRTSTSQFCETYPHLLSCGLQQKLESPLNNTYHGIWFSTGLTSEGKNQQMLDDYCSMFAMNDTICGPTPAPTNAPSPKPSALPTPKPTFKNISNAPTTDPTNNPTPSPSSTTISPTISPTSITGYYLYNQSFTNYCQLDRFNDNSQYLWLFTLCCSETKVVTIAPTATTIQPSVSPTSQPTNNTLPPSLFKFSDSEASSFTTDAYPLNLGALPASLPTPAPTTAFDDVGDGIVDFIHWGVSNINRTFKYINNNYKDGIAQVIDIPLNQYYFSIKRYTLRSGIEFVSEYGSIYVPDNDTVNPCSDISKSEINIVAIHIYINDTTYAIEGMTMFRTVMEDKIGVVGDNYTCHIAMAQQNDSSQAFKDKLYYTDIAKYPNNTVNFLNCSSSGLAGFRGYAPGPGIKQMKFEFVGNPDSTTKGNNCPGQTTTTTTSTTTSLAPTPAPTPIPTIATTPTTAAPTLANSDLTLKCYHVMNKNNVSCANIYDQNPSFMTNCMAYSITEQPNSWYINQNNQCIVSARGGDMGRNMAAIATCCRLNLIQIFTECEKAGITWTTNEWFCRNGVTGLIFAVSLGGLISVVLIWAVFIVFCVVQNKKKAAADARKKRLKAPPKIVERGKHKEKVALFTQEQMDDRVSLDKFKVDETHHKEMLQQQQLLSQHNFVGLQAD